MDTKQFGFKVAVAVLFAVVLATYGFYWLGISRLHDHVQRLAVASNHLKQGESFHSAIHSMLLDAEGFYKSEGQGNYREMYKGHRAVAEKALAELRNHVRQMPPGKDRESVNRQTEGIASAFAEYKAALDRIMAGDLSQTGQRLAWCAAKFNSIFKKYYVHLHDHHAHIQTQLSQSSSQTWRATSTVFGLQLGLAVVAGLLVILYLDRVVRYGGEEFLVVLKGVGPEEILAVAEKLRAAIAGRQFVLPDGHAASPVTASLGAAVYPHDGAHFQAVARRADARLYEAKEQGRNRVKGPKNVMEPTPGQ